MQATESIDKIESLNKLKITSIERDLWIAYWDDSSNVNRDALVEYYIPWIHSTVLKKLINSLPASVDVDSIIQRGCMALLDVIPKYNGSVKFTSYAQLRIRGSAGDELRDMDFVPRATRVRMKKRKELEDNGLNVEEHMSYREFSDTVPPKIGSISKIVSKTDNKDVCVGDGLIGKNEEFRVILDDNFREICKGCSLEEQTILFLYYYKNKTMKFISDALDLSESRISQQHKDLLIRLYRNYRI